MTQDQTRALVERLHGNPYGMTHINSQLGINEPRNMIREAADLVERQSRIIAAHEQQVKDGAELIERLQRALMFWMPSVDMRLDPATREIAAQDAHLLAGYTSTTDEPCWGDGILERALAAESSLKAAVEAEREACAKVADTKAEKADSGSRDVHVAVQEAAWIDCANSIAAAIRSRAVGGNET